MSTFLHRLGARCAKRGWIVLGIWLAVLVALGAGFLALSPKLSNNFVIPGTQAQDGLEQLAERFPQMSGVSGQLVVCSDDGSPIENQRERVNNIATQASTINTVVAATGPWDPILRQPLVSTDGSCGLINVQFSFSLDDLDTASRDQIHALAEAESTNGLTVVDGGQMYQMTSIPLSIMEVIGVGVGLMVLVVTFRSFLPAALPIVSALIGIGVSMFSVMLMASQVDISTTTPTLAVMIGLAVGIDYSLFIVSRHRSQLADGQDVVASIALANATAGGSVLFAAATVVIALCGLLVTRIPFLAIMGLCAAFAVAIAGMMAVTGIPALLGLMGDKLRPKQAKRSPRRNIGHHSQWWVTKVTKRPWLTMVFVLIAVAALTWPIGALRLSLPDNGIEAPGTPARDTYDLVEQKFGRGANSPLLVIGNIIQSQDPLGVVDDIASKIEAEPGVSSVQIATPNQNADMGVIVVVPSDTGESTATEALVHQLREDAASWENPTGMTHIAVTGMTAAKIDITQRLSNALLPFALVVVGLALVILTVVFRSIWVPVTASLGYLLSVAAALGVSAAVFGKGWGSALLGVAHQGPVICFMPIMVLGVLFGLAMDYEVFLVSRMREAWSHGIAAKEAVRQGFVASARVVTAAALIMVSVFMGFLPHGSYYVQPIALGLAVGVAVDAFLVRMTLLPAIMVWLSDRAWACPHWLASRLPHVDIEGSAMTHRVEHDAWTKEHGNAVVRAHDVVLHNQQGRPVIQVPELVIRAGQTVVLDGSADTVRAVLAAIAGRARTSGVLVVNDQVVKDRSSWIKAHVPLVISAFDAPAIAKRMRRMKGIVACVDAPIDRASAHQILTSTVKSGGALILGATAYQQDFCSLTPLEITTVTIEEVSDGVAS